jgi:hypothetical protein
VTVKVKLLLCCEGCDAEAEFPGILTLAGHVVEEGYARPDGWEERRGYGGDSITLCPKCSEDPARERHWHGRP